MHDHSGIFQFDVNNMTSSFESSVFKNSFIHHRMAVVLFSLEAAYYCETARSH